MRRARWLGPLVVVSVWALVSWLELMNPVLLPSPVTVAREVVRLLAGPISEDFFSTVARVFAGLALAGAVGLPLGLVLGTTPSAERAVAAPLDLYRSVPAVAFIPLFVVLLGIGEVAKLAVAAGAVLPIVVLSTAAGVRSGRKTRRLLIKSLGMRPAQALRLVVFPEALPHVLSGARLAVSAGTSVVLAAEMFVGATHGLGRRIADAQLLFRVPELYATVLIAACLGLGLNALVLLLERRALHWVGH